MATYNKTAAHSAARKRSAVEELTDKLSRSTSTVLTDYRGVGVSDLERLRAVLRAESVDYIVIKNTLARRAAEAAGVTALNPALEGPVALALGYGDISAPARILTTYFRANRIAPIVGGIVEGRYLNAESVRTVADLPSRDVLLSQLAGALQSPLSGLAGAMASIMSNFAATLDAYRMQREAA